MSPKTQPIWGINQPEVRPRFPSVLNVYTTKPTFIVRHLSLKSCASNGRVCFKNGREIFACCLNKQRIISTAKLPDKRTWIVIAIVYCETVMTTLARIFQIKSVENEEQDWKFIDFIVADEIFTRMIIQVFFRVVEGLKLSLKLWRVSTWYIRCTMRMTMIWLL